MKTEGESYESLSKIANGVFIAEEVIELYYARLVRLAKKKLSALPPQVADEEGAVISALRSFFSGIQNGKFPNVKNEDDLWRLLATITARKSIRQMRAHWKQSGEADKVIRVSDIQHLLPTEPSVDEELAIMEEFEHLTSNLNDETLNKIVCMRLEGFETLEIAERLGIHVRSVQRKLNLVKTKWAEHLQEL